MDHWGELIFIEGSMFNEEICLAIAHRTDSLFRRFDPEYSVFASVFLAWRSFPTWTCLISADGNRVELPFCETETLIFLIAWLPTAQAAPFAKKDWHRHFPRL